MVHWTTLPPREHAMGQASPLPSGAYSSGGNTSNAEEISFAWCASPSATTATATADASPKASAIAIEGAEGNDERSGPGVSVQEAAKHAAAAEKAIKEAHDDNDGGSGAGAGAGNGKEKKEEEEKEDCRRLRAGGDGDGDSDSGRPGATAKHEAEEKGKGKEGEGEGAGLGERRGGVEVYRRWVASAGGKEVYSPADLDVLALFFTVVKVLCCRQNTCWSWGRD